MKKYNLKVFTGIFFLLFMGPKPLKSFTCTLDDLAGEQPSEVCTIRDFLKMLQEKNNISVSKLSSNAFILYGERGLGKTTIAESLAASIQENSKKNSIRKLAADIFEHENPAKVIREMYNNAKEATKNTDGTKRPYIIIIDDIDNYAKSAIEKQTVKERAGIDVLRDEIDNHEHDPYIITLLITNKYEEIDERLKSRCIDIHCYLPNFDSRVAIIKLYARLSQATFLSDDEFIKRLAYEMEFFPGRDIQQVFKWASEKKQGNPIDKSVVLIALQKMITRNMQDFLEKHGIAYYCSCNNKAITREDITSKFLSKRENEIKGKYGWWCYHFCWSCNKEKMVTDPFQPCEKLPKVD